MTKKQKNFRLSAHNSQLFCILDLRRRYFLSRKVKILLVFSSLIRIFAKEMEKYIEIKGARVNNLKNISLKIPRNQLITVTGVSGSGKSSLAFDTLYAEGQRRYVESLSSYARQFLGRITLEGREHSFWGARAMLLQFWDINFALSAQCSLFSGALWEQEKSKIIENRLQFTSVFSRMHLDGDRHL